MRLWTAHKEKTANTYQNGNNHLQRDTAACRLRKSICWPFMGKEATSQENWCQPLTSKTPEVETDGKPAVPEPNNAQETFSKVLSSGNNQSAYTQPLHALTLTLTVITEGKCSLSRSLSLTSGGMSAHYQDPWSPIHLLAVPCSHQFCLFPGGWWRCDVK